ncbi:MAG: hypothetical protein E7520_04375 [Ruminococcaceae bacterium]|nr:hypothetical protein [Oscillospiraceae bacterium]
MKRRTKMKRVLSLVCIVLMLLSLTIFDDNDFVFADSLFTFETVDDAGNLILKKYTGDEEIVEIPEEYNGHKVTVIGNLSFEYKGVVREIHFPRTVTEIRTNAFFGCVKCEKYVVSPDNPVYASEDGVIYSGDMKTLCFCPEFYQAETFAVKDGITTIGAYAFRFHKNYGAASSSDYGYSKIQHITFPNTLTKIGSEAFAGTRIKEFIFPDSVTEFSAHALNDNTVYTKIHIGAGMKATDCSFLNIGSLQEISVSEDNEELCCEDNLLLSKDKKVLYCVPGGTKADTFRVPDSVDIIEKNAFKSNHFKAVDFNNARVIYNPFDAGSYNITDWVFPKSTEYVSGEISSKTTSLSFLNKNCEIALTCKMAASYSSGYRFNVNGYYGSTAEAFVKNNTNAKVDMTFVPFHSEDAEGDISSFVHDYQGVVVAPTCTERGYTQYTCKICGIQYKAHYVDVLGHDYQPLRIVPPSCTEQGYTVYQCSRCPATTRSDYINPQGHNMSVVEKTEPTCTENGHILYQCITCSETQETQLDALGHHFVAEEVVSPTCTNAGYSTYVCQNCPFTYDGDYAEPLGHSYVTNIIAATHTEDGTATLRCSRCPHIKSKRKIFHISQVSVNQISYVYTGSKIKLPVVTAKASNGSTVAAKNYTVEYISRASGKRVSSVTAIGQYKAVVHFYNEYAGENTFYFYVKPKKQAVSKLSTARKSITAKWKKDKAASGYEIQIATNKSFTKSVKKFTVSGNTSTSKKITNLKKGKRYYIRIRSFKSVKVDGKTTKMYSDYSAAKSIICK